MNEFDLSRLGSLLLGNETQYLSILEDNLDLIIVVGAWEGSELIDRVGAYELQRELEKRGINAIVLTDTYLATIGDRYADRPLFLIGGPPANSLSAQYFGELKGTVFGFREFDGRLVGYAFGDTGRETLIAVKQFILNQLEAFFTKLLIERGIRRVKGFIKLLEPSELAHQTVDKAVEMPAADKRTGQIVSVSGNTAEVMDLETFEILEVPIPKEIAGKISSGAEVEYWVSMGKKRIVKVISGNTTAMDSETFP